MSEESKIISSFSLQETLNPKIWDNYANPKKASLKPEIRKKLLEIAHEFMDFIDVEFFVDDIIFTGSLSNFNWSDFSDVDLHLEVDFMQFDRDSVELYRELFNLKKLLFNTNHDITIKGFEVELYVQDIIEPHTSGGIYSVLYDEWVVIPEKKDVTIDKNLLRRKITAWTKKIDEVTEQVKNDDYDESIILIKELRDKIKKYRKAGLEDKGEFSYENLVFKYLRRGKYIERLIDLSHKLKDKKLSLESLTEAALIGGNFKWGGGPSEHGKRAFGNWQSDNAYDLMAPVGTPVYSLVDGIIEKTYFTEGGETGKQSKVYGWQVTIKSDDNKFFYTHLGNINPNIKPGNKISRGDLIGTIGAPKSGRKWYPHLHIGIENGDLKSYIDDDSQIKKETRKQESIFDAILRFLGLDDLISQDEKKFVEELENLIKSNKELKWEKTEKLGYDNDVEILQSVLQLLGYSLSKWGVDGKFGPETSAAVVNFQKKNGLTPNGVVDKNTLKTILKELSKIDLNKEKISGIQKEKEKLNISVNDNKNKILRFLTDKGLTIEQASGIAGNLQAESNFNPTAVGDSGTSLGIAQWHKSRKESLISFCNSKKQNSESLECQLDFLWDELTTKYSNVLSSIKSSENASTSAEIFASKYEKPRSTDYSRRIKFAEKIYNDALIS
jgi:murein DD-endopeptidase MepM/ murein hydrolase activator NlpD